MTYRIIQWVTGDVGQVGVRHFADSPVFDLVGVLVHSKDKVGKDAGEIAGIAPIGVTATDDIPCGTVDGRPLIVFEALYTTTGTDNKLDPAWDFGKTRYRISIEGDPPTELILQGVEQPDGTMAHPGYNWTAMGAINGIPDVCDAAPGWLTHLDLGLIRPRGLVRT
jgi:hypothetical protein